MSTINAVSNITASTGVADNRTTLEGMNFVQLLKLVMAAIEKMDDAVRDADYSSSIQQQVNSFDAQIDSFDKQKEAAGKHKKAGLFEAVGSIASAGLMGGLTIFHGSAEQGFKDLTKPDLHALKHGKARNVFADGERRVVTKEAKQRLAEAEENHLRMLRQPVGSEEEKRLSQLMKPKEVEANFEAVHGRKLGAPVYRISSHFTGHAEVYGRAVEPFTKIGSNHVNYGAGTDERTGEFDKTLEKYFEKDVDNYAQKARTASSDMKQAVSSIVQLLGKLNDAVHIS